LQFSSTLQALEGLCERQIAAGASAVVVCETAGEASTLSTAERDLIIRAAAEIASEARTDHCGRRFELHQSRHRIDTTRGSGRCRRSSFSRALL
jgi:hypothetical protein